MTHISFRLTLILLLALLLGACGGSASDADMGRDSAGAMAEAPVESQGEMAAEESAMDGGDAVAGSGDEASQALAQAQTNRKIIYTGSLQLRVDDPRLVSQALQALAQRYGGYVSGANLYEEYDKSYRASVQLRVPADNFDAAMAELRNLASEVLNESIGTQDVTDRYVDLTARIDNLERTEEELQLLLSDSRERGAKTEDILAIYRELTEIRGQIESLQGQLNVLADQVSLATINVELMPPDAQVEIVNEGWSITRTLRQALRTLTEGLQLLTSLVIYFLIAIAPILAIGLLALYVLYRLLRWIAQRARQGMPPAPPAPPPSTPPTD